MIVTNHRNFSPGMTGKNSFVKTALGYYMMNKYGNITQSAKTNTIATTTTTTTTTNLIL
jgi:hypothetical protein